MLVMCCSKVLFPHTMGSPKLGDEVKDYSCPTCGKQYTLTIFKPETYKRLYGDPPPGPEAQPFHCYIGMWMGKVQVRFGEATVKAFLEDEFKKHYGPNKLFQWNGTMLETYTGSHFARYERVFVS